VHYRKANGKLAPKVFKLAEKTLPAGSTLSLSTGHSFRTMTTRKHYPGKHQVEIVINGRTYESITFQLTS